MKNLPGLVFAAGFLVLAGLLVFQRHPGHHAKPPLGRSRGQLPVWAPTLSPGVAFSSFGPSNTFGPSRWSAGANAHADWFVPKYSGRLRALEVAAEPAFVGKGWEKRAGTLEVFVAQDEEGAPGKVLERFAFAPGTSNAPPPTLPLELPSAAHPKLHVGRKYWLAARSTGPIGWTWHFGDRNCVQNARRQNEQGQWVSAGDYCYVGAFSILVTTNQDLEEEVP